jgi:hypothetical protein
MRRLAAYSIAFALRLPQPMRSFLSFLHVPVAVIAQEVILVERMQYSL